ncbi:hypothetical protein TUM17377_23830 [Shewanella chilikensis]|nr:hypothetical protein TUM17377_23830 [Shewanella chilikensis]
MLCDSPSGTLYTSDFNWIGIAEAGGGDTKENKTASTSEKESVRPCRKLGINLVNFIMSDASIVSDNSFRKLPDCQN